MSEFYTVPYSRQESIAEPHDNDPDGPGHLYCHPTVLRRSAKVADDTTNYRGLLAADRQDGHF